MTIARVGLPLRARRLAESSTVVESVRMMLPGRVAVPGLGLGRMKTPLVLAGTLAMGHLLTLSCYHTMNKRMNSPSPSEVLS